MLFSQEMVTKFANAEQLYAKLKWEESTQNTKQSNWVIITAFAAMSIQINLLIPFPIHHFYEFICEVRDLSYMRMNRCNISNTNDSIFFSR